MTITDSADRHALLAYIDFSTEVGDLVNKYKHLPTSVLHYALLQKAYEVAACSVLPQQFRTPIPTIQPQKEEG